MKKMSHAEFMQACGKQFDDPSIHHRHWAFVCPVCGTVQSAESLIRAGVKRAMVDGALGFACVGRFTGAGEHEQGERPGRGCDYTLGGLFKLHELEVEMDGRRNPMFNLASNEQALHLYNLHQKDPEIITERARRPIILKDAGPE